MTVPPRLPRRVRPGKRAGMPLLTRRGDPDRGLGEAVSASAWVRSPSATCCSSSCVFVAATSASITSFPVLPFASASACSAVPSRERSVHLLGRHPERLAIASSQRRGCGGAHRATDPARPDGAAGRRRPPRPGSAVANLATIASSCAAVIVPSSTSGCSRSLTRRSRSAVGLGVSAAGLGASGVGGAGVVPDGSDEPLREAAVWLSPHWRRWS